MDGLSGEEKGYERERTAVYLKGVKIMEYVAPLAPIAFVFALAALVQVGSLKKEVEKLKEELNSKL